MLREIFPPLKNIALPEKKLENTGTVDRLFFLRMEIRPNSSANSTTPPPIHPCSRAQQLRFLLANYLASRFSRVTLCFRRSGVSGSYIRAAAAGTSSLASFPSSKVQASFAALRHICMYNVYTCTCWLSRCRNVLYSLYEYLKFCSDTSRASRTREIHREMRLRMALSNDRDFSRESQMIRDI